jgi:L-ascorbate metabolism protein UlaG (beta-lactamase superfamily)
MERGAIRLVKNWKRRTILGAGTAGIAGVGALVYRAAPTFWNQYAAEWKRDVLPAPSIPDVKRWPDQGLHAAWLGHSTVLLKIDGFTILTDPVFSERAGINLGVTTLGVKRIVAPPLEIRGLPDIDLVLLSHAHMDHFDLPSLRRLESKHLDVITAAQTSDLLHLPRYRSVSELQWGEDRRVGPAVIRGLEVNHWGARVRTDTFRGYNGYLIEVGRYRVLFAGDTANTDKLRGIARSVDLAIMPIGAYNPWIRYHCNPEQAWRITQEARAEHILPVHHSTFQLSREPVTEPLERLQIAAGRHSARIVIHNVGQEFHLA